MADVRHRYRQRPVFINVDGRNVDAALGTAFYAAGCSIGKTEIFLTHVGAIPPFPTIPGLAVGSVTESNLSAFAVTRLKAFADTEAELDPVDVEDELSVRRAELAEAGRGLLACIHGEPVGGVWWHADPKDIWVTYLATRVPFRGQGIGQWLLCHCLVDAYNRGCRSVLLNVTTDNETAIQLYRRIGFIDEVWWRRRYVLE